jgi:hypothetical protein
MGFPIVKMLYPQEWVNLPSDMSQFCDKCLLYLTYQVATILEVGCPLIWIGSCYENSRLTKIACNIVVRIDVTKPLSPKLNLTATRN